VNVTAVAGKSLPDVVMGNELGIGVDRNPRPEVAELLRIIGAA